MFDTDVDTEAAGSLPICRLITFDASTVDVVVGCIESVAFVRQIDADRIIAFVSIDRMFLVFRNILTVVSMSYKDQTKSIVSAIVV